MPPRPRTVSKSALRAERGAAAQTARGTTGRAELAARHPALQEVSPEVGRLDEDAFAQLLAADPDAALALLADLARATDRRLREAAQRLAARTGISTWTGRWTAGPGRGRRGTLTWSPGPGSHRAGRSAC